MKLEDKSLASIGHAPDPLAEFILLTKSNANLSTLKRITKRTLGCSDCYVGKKLQNSKENELLLPPSERMLYGI